MAESKQRKSVADRREGDRRKADRRRADGDATDRAGKPAEAESTERPSRQRTAAPGTAPWVVPTMVSLLLLGVIWIVVFYVAGYLIPFMAAMGNWNLAVGMGLIAASFVVATQWK
ncbi:cell division protein CrgA [Raineyella sp.]|uniref:cell division protein CrgA n=1 Tax=Raineyella sp. TaxID=1911550 RepID=UPI002B215337|nr:cell division protein CrgA [Raineyella sp.]MEA5154961.1 cell division protein CrgA [Raineyella sp.]